MDQSDSGYDTGGPSTTEPQADKSRCPHCSLHKSPEPVAAEPVGSNSTVQCDYVGTADDFVMPVGPSNEYSSVNTIVTLPNKLVG